jgi:hypothetical protein
VRELAEAVETAAAGMAAAANRMASDMAAQIGGIEETVAAAAPPAETAGAQVGRAITDGIVEGVRSGTSAVADACAQAVNAGIQAAEQEAQVESPSKRMEWVGRMMALGIPEGFERESRAVVAGARALMDRIIAEAEATLTSYRGMAPAVAAAPVPVVAGGGGGKWGGGGTTYGPTYVIEGVNFTPDGPEEEELWDRVGQMIGRHARRQGREGGGG